MEWLQLTPDEGPFYQMQRIARYKEVLVKLQEKGLVYPCYMSMQELDALREKQMANKEKPRYDGTWRPEPGKQLPPVPEGVQPVLRFKTPQGGVVAWEDKWKAIGAINPRVNGFEASCFDGVYVTGDISDGDIAALNAGRTGGAEEGDVDTSRLSLPNAQDA